ncbi:hypothetical protein HMN09_00732400 [Mycena chlorophos]|uniref:Uncharacterized protein n=1 Tax=Mycena chlorophos TaxID=658473 RepID=A0A8H6SW57_MYCCL|nr:hypothetical protein HMN09_00732400 [Mycena chlorophos]
MAANAPRRVTRGAVIAGRPAALSSIQGITTGDALPHINPIELNLDLMCLICFEVTDRKTLARLCRVSRAFRDAAQPVLHKTVDIASGVNSEPRTKRWLVAALRYPDLAARVRTLVIQIPDQPDDADAFGAAFRACINLRELHTLRIRPTPKRNANKATNTVMLKDCSLRLRTFVNSYFTFGPNLAEFLSGQPQLRVLVGPDAAPINKQLFTHLPNLVAVEADIGSLPDGRPLERIATALLENGISDIACLSVYSATLTTLTLTVDSSQKPAEVIRAVGAACPRLRHLLVTENHVPSPVTGRRSTPFRGLPIDDTTYLAAFGELQTLGLLTTTGPDRKEYVVPMARSAIEGCATLRRVIVSTKRRSCIARRADADGTITLEEQGQIYRFDKMSMLLE